MQAFVDRFKARPSKAKTAQSRHEGHRKMVPITPREEPARQVLPSRNLTSWRTDHQH